MINIIKSLLQQLKFSTAQQESLPELPAETFFASYVSSQKEEYFVVLPVGHISQARQTVEGLVDGMASWKGSQPGVAKNTNLLLLWQALSEEEIENSKKLIFEMEEDPYEFKKYVLFYTEPELLEFKGKFSKQDYDLALLQHELNCSDSFVAFKRYLKSKGTPDACTFLWYSLLSRIFIKIPILRTSQQHQELYDLQMAIDSRISQRGLSRLQQEILKLDENDLEPGPIDELIDRMCDE